MQQIIKGSNSVLLIESDKIEIFDAQSALDLMATARYEHECDRIAINKSAICEDFFVLSTGIAGEILQKFANYRLKLAIYGDYSGYKSKALHDFIYESNNGSGIFFTTTAEEAVERLVAAK